MAINLATQYEKKVAERYALGSLTDSGAGKDYSFAGARTINIYSIETVPLTDYTRSGNARYGTVSELEDVTQELTVVPDRCFTFSIDAGNDSEQFNVKQANACLKREIDEVVSPEIDAYRLSAWAAGKGLSAGNTVQSSSDGALTKSNIVDAIFNASARLSDSMAPRNGRFLFIPELTFVKFKLADVVIGAEGMSEENIKTGYKGTIDGMRVVSVPASIFPSGVNFIVKQKNATVDPFKLKNYRVQKNPMGIDGDVVEGRIIYDSFVLDSKCSGVFVSKV